MLKSGRTRAEQQFSTNQKKDDALVKQKEKAERDRDDRMARLRDLRLSKEMDEAAQRDAAEPTVVSEEPAAPESTELVSSRLPRVHPHRS